MANSLLDKEGRLNTKNYNQKVRKQQEVFSKIDSTMAILEKLPTFVDTALDTLNANSFTFSNSPLGFLFNILKSLGVDEETLKKWIVDILVYVLPTVEIGIKASLLANIKSLISCNSDPRIPLRMRKKISNDVFTNILTDNTDNNRGIDINVEAIDPEGILDMSPFTEPGKQYYFGCTKDAVTDKVIQDADGGVQLDEIVITGSSNSKTARLVRADDFNAFLWYVVHKGNKQTPAPVKINGNKFTNYLYDTNTYTITSDNKNLLGTIELKVDGEDKESNIIAGNTFYDEQTPNNIAICVKSSTDSKGVVTGNTLVPVSSDWFSCNWYVDNTNYYGSNSGIKKGGQRDYNKEKAICNLRYCTRHDYKGREIPNAPSNIRFTILPKPYILLPTIANDSFYTEEVVSKVQWRPIRLLFDANGKPDQKGKFSLISETYDLTPTLVKRDSNADFLRYDVYGYYEGIMQPCTELTVSVKTGRYMINTSEYPNSYKCALVECYPGLTVYEFNYDYIMGMRLFDPKVVCQKILNNAANPKYNASYQLSLNRLKDSSKHSYEAGKQQVIEIVRTILEEDEDEINDCFFSFSNEQYYEMLNRAEEMRYHQSPLNQGYNDGYTVDFDSVSAILNGFPENGTLDEQKEVISQALTQACNVLDSSKSTTVSTDKSTIKVDFLTNILEQLVQAIVDAVLSPKVLMLLMVNNSLMSSQSDETLNTEQLLRILKNVIKSLVKEVRDLIMKKILDYIIQMLTPLALQIQAKVLSEQFAAYMAIIRLLLSWYNKGVETVSRLSSILSSILSRFNRNGSGEDGEDFSDIDLASIMDTVDYADIYPSDEKDKEPIINDC